MQLRQIKSFLNNPNALLSDKCLRSFFSFVVEFWDVVVNDTPIFNWHIPYICGEMTKMVNRVSKMQPSLYDLVINIPPGSTKSLLTTVFFPAWCWAKWPHLKFIKTSYSSTLSLEHAEACRDVVKSDKYQTLFPYIRIKRDKDKKSNFKIQYQDQETKIWKNGGNLFSTSVEGTLTGFHGHFLLVDDPIDPFKAYSKSQLENVNRWLEQVLPTRKVEKSVVPTVMIMQRVDEYDPSWALLELKKQGYPVKLICLPGIAKKTADKQNVHPEEVRKYYNKQNGYLDPIRLNDKALNDLELKLGQYGYLSQVQQNPKSAGKGMFKSGKVNIVDLETFNLAPKLIRIVRYWDKAGTQDGGKFTAGVKMGALKGGKFIILDVVRGQWGSSRREAKIDETALDDSNQVLIKIEQEPGSGGKESAEATRNRLRNMGMKVKTDRPTGDKIYRADPWSVVWNRGDVYLVEADWNDDYLDEHKRFPGGTRTLKDQVDASSGAYAELSLSGKIGTW